MMKPFIQAWFSVKEQAELSLHLSSDALHVNVGVGLFLFFSLFARRRKWLIMPWLVLFGLELLNEFFDMRSVNYESDWSSSVRDFINTMTLPTVLLFFMKFSERPWTRAGVTKVDSVATGENESSDPLNHAGDQALK